VIRTELGLRLPNNAGALAGVCRLLADARVGVIAMSLGAGGELRLVVDNHVHGAGVLREGHHQVTERQVLVLTAADAPGALAGPLRLVADAGVNINYVYGAAASVVIGVDDAMSASAATGI